MPPKPLVRWEVIFTPPIVAAFATLVPPLLAAAWKLGTPGYSCTPNASPLNSPCFAIVWMAALGAGWLVGAIANRLGRRAGQAPQAGAGAERRGRIARLVAGAVGFALGLPLAGFVLNPCP